MFKASIGLSLLAFGLIAHSEVKDPHESPQYEALKQSVKELPFTVVLDRSKPIQLIWKDGSRVAEFQLGSKTLNLDVPLNFTQNSCGNKATGRICKLQYYGATQGLRLVGKSIPRLHGLIRL